jgi:hypothetical protein
VPKSTDSCSKLTERSERGRNLPNRSIAFHSNQSNTATFRSGEALAFDLEWQLSDREIVETITASEVLDLSTSTNHDILYSAVGKLGKRCEIPGI